MKQVIFRVYLIVFTLLVSVHAQTSNQPGTGTNNGQETTYYPTSIQDVADTVYDGYLDFMGKLSQTFANYFDQKSKSFQGFNNWISSNNFWALVDINKDQDPNTGKKLAMSQSYNLQVQAAQNANFNASVAPERFVSMNDLVQLLMVGVVFPVTDGTSADNNIIKYKALTDVNVNKCKSDWEKRFSPDDYDILCNDNNPNVGKIMDVISDNIVDIDFYRRLIFYYNQVKNCSDSIDSLKNTTSSSSSSSSSSIGGQTMPDTSDLTASSGIPYVQCYFASDNELASTIKSELQSACSQLSASSLYQDCKDLYDSFSDYADDAKTALKGITYSATTDNGVSSSYGPVVSNMLSKLESTLKDTQEIVYSEIFNSDLMVNEIPLMESIYPSMDNIMLPTQYGNQSCDPTKADQDTSFEYFKATDSSSIDYAYFYITNLDQTIPTGLSLSESIDMNNLDDTTSNTIPVYIHGGRFIYCNNNSSSSSVYNNLCQDEDANVYTTDLASTRSGLYSSIASIRENLATSASVYVAQRSAAFSNLWDMYNKRALVGNASRCTPAQLATYHATWRYVRKSANEPSWQETIRNSNDLTQMDLMREAVLLLQDINYQLHELNETSERSMSIETIVALNQLSTSAFSQYSSLLTSSIAEFNTGYQSTSSSSPSTSDLGS